MLDLNSAGIAVILLLMLAFLVSLYVDLRQERNGAPKRTIRTW